jgi:uncharacterized membrane protein YebE (DUF533 family)
MGALAVAVEAFDHYSGKKSAPSSGTPAGAPPSPPPPPPPPPPATDIASQETGHPEAMLLIRSMIAAANADGVIDEAERAAILGKLNESGIPPEDQSFVIHELFSPKGVEELVEGVDDPALAERMYLVSLMAITVDSEAEHEYLRQLAEKLRLDEAQLERLHASVSA